MTKHEIMLKIRELQRLVDRERSMENAVRKDIAAVDEIIKRVSIESSRAHDERARKERELAKVSTAQYRLKSADRYRSGMEGVLNGSAFHNILRAVEDARRRSQMEQNRLREIQARHIHKIRQYNNEISRLHTMLKTAPN